MNLNNIVYPELRAGMSREKLSQIKRSGRLSQLGYIAITTIPIGIKGGIKVYYENMGNGEKHMR